MSRSARHALPFPALVGQEDLKLGLVLNVVNPRIGGLLIRGPKGTGKSTAVHALARLLPERAEVEGCPFRCVPARPAHLCDSCREGLESGDDLPLVPGRMRVVTLPLSITEDRLVGAIDMERMLKHGETAFQPGLLARANNDLLYVDEINLLPDHVADDILDAAALGTNTVEREGFSVTHPSSFVLVGTMNPEEGDLRPQLLDRLPLSVSPGTLRDVDMRVEIVRRNMMAQQDPAGLAARFASEEDALRTRIAEARERLGAVTMGRRLLRASAVACVALRVDGHRPEIVITRAAMTLAAYRGRTHVEPADLRDAARLALAHRTRDGGFEPPASDEEILAAFDAALAGDDLGPSGDEAFGAAADPAETDREPDLDVKKKATTS